MPELFEVLPKITAIAIDQKIIGLIPFQPVNQVNGFREL
jgi:hypothetical protein